MARTFTTWADNGQHNRQSQKWKSIAEASQAHAFCNMILDPVAIPPLLGIDLNAFQLHAEVNVVAPRHAGLAALAHDLAALHHVTFVDRNFTQVAVDGLQAIAVVYHYAIAVDAERGSIHYTAIVRRLYTNVLRDGKIVAQVNLPIDLFPLVNVVPLVGETGFHLGVVLLQEGL